MPETETVLAHVAEPYEERNSFAYIGSFAAHAVRSLVPEGREARLAAEYFRLKSGENFSIYFLEKSSAESLNECCNQPCAAIKVAIPL